MCSIARAGQPLPPIPYDAYHLCIFVRHRTIEVAYTSISLFYGAYERYHRFGSGDVRLTLLMVCTPDFLAFSLITFLALRWGAGKLRIPTLMGTVAEDAVWYFAVIFTSHFVLEMTLLLGRVSVTVPPPSVAPPITFNPCVRRNLSNYFQQGKSITDPNCSPPS